MKIKTIFKILIVFLILMTVFCSTKVFAKDMSDLTNPNQFDDVGELAIPGSSTTIENVIAKALGVILTILRIVALGWGIMMAFSIAIKYMMAKPSTKSALKLDMPTYVIGAVLLFGASGLMTLLQYFVEDIFG